MSVETQPHQITEPEGYDYPVYLQGVTTAAPTVINGKGITVTRASAGVLTLTFAEDPGPNFLGGTPGFGDATASNVLGYSVCFGAYTAKSGSTKATLAITILGGGSPTFYTDRTKDTPAGPSFVTDANGNSGPYYLDPGRYQVTVTDALGNSHGPYYFSVPVDPYEPAWLTSDTPITADPAPAVARTLYLVNCTAGAVVVTLDPDANQGDQVRCKKTDSSGNHVTITAAADIDGSGTLAVTAQHQCIECTFDGTTWDATTVYP